MNIQIICIGKLKEKYWTEAIKEYSKRLSRFCTLDIIELKELCKQIPDSERGGVTIASPNGNSIFLSAEWRLLSSTRRGELLGLNIYSLVDNDYLHPHEIDYGEAKIIRYICKPVF